MRVDSQSAVDLAGRTIDGILAAAATPEVVSTDHSIMQLMFGSGPVVQGVLYILLLMSVVTWGIVISKWFQFSTARRQTKQFTDAFWNSKNLLQVNQASQKFSASPVASVFAAGHRELMRLVRGKEKREGADNFADGAELEIIDRALKRAKFEELTRLEKGTTFLATTASAAPFIGLFGTVWGIMNAFIGLSKVASSSIQAVAPGISEALIATAIGLAAAIPAAIAFNYFSQQVRILARNMDMLSAEFLNIAGRDVLSR